MAKNKKEIKYPKPNDKLNKKKSKSRKNKDKGKQSKPNKSKINLIIKKINKISINKTEERKTKKNNKYNNDIKYYENPIEEYEEEIMNNLFHEENKNRAIYSLFPNPMDKDSNINSQNLTYMKRFSFINLFISFQHELILKQETLYLTINIFDRYIQKLNSQRIIAEDINKIAVTCLFIASKYEEIYPPYLKEFLQIFKLKYIKREIILTELDILSALDFEILTVYPILFLKKFCLYDIESLNKKEKEDLDLCFNGAQFFLELCLIEPKFCELKPSLQAAISLYLARKFLLFNNGRGKIWNYDLVFRTNYTENHIKKNIKIAVQTIKNFFGNVYTKNFIALPLYIKYYGARYSRISNKLKSIINGEEK